MTWSNLLIYLFASALIVSCTTTLSPTVDIVQSGNSAAAHCGVFYKQLRNSIYAAGVQDAQAVPIDGYPYLRINRFYASFSEELHDTAKFNAWVQYLQQLALTAYTMEINNLAPPQRNELAQRIPAPLTKKGDLLNLLSYCSDLLIEQELPIDGNRARLLLNSEVPDDYHTWQRALGLYALTSIPFASGINSWHKESESELTKSIDKLAVHGQLTRYATPEVSEFTSYQAIQRELELATQNPLQIPLLTPELTQRMFVTFSPIWEIDVVTDDDKIGTPFWPGDGQRAKIDPGQASVYTLLSYTRFANDILLQLNYIVWFPARPCTSNIDLLCGHMDGLIWRVTIGKDGKPLVYDTIHNCGCYHTFFPSEKLIIKSYEPTIEEHAFVPIRAPSSDIRQKIVLRISHRTHYIDGLYVDDADPSKFQSLTWADYNGLRSLKVEHGLRRSLFEKNGIIDGTQRGERWIFWPMGVPSAGAMRQWGTHATAFVGRRHFDDPFIMQDSFELK